MRWSDDYFLHRDRRGDGVAGAFSGGRGLRRQRRDFQFAEHRIAIVNRQQIDAGVDDFVVALQHPSAQTIAVGLDRFHQQNRTTACNRVLRAFERLQFHALDIDLDEIHARQLERVQRHLFDGDGVGIVDRLADEFIIGAWFQFEAAETRGGEIIRRRICMMPDSDATATRMAMALKQLLIAMFSRQRIVDALLRLDRNDGTPAGHRGRPLDRVDPDIGAAIDRHHAVAMMAPTQFEQLHRDLDFPADRRRRPRESGSRRRSRVRYRPCGSRSD